MRSGWHSTKSPPEHQIDTQELVYGGCSKVLPSFTARTGTGRLFTEELFLSVRYLQNVLHTEFVPGRGMAAEELVVLDT